MNRYCLALDLKDDPKIIEQYIEHHKRVSDEIIASIKNADIQVMDIYLTGNRLFMIMEVGDTFSFEEKAKMDESNEKVQEWEGLMSTLQQTLPWAKPGEKWVLMEKIFSL
ncbi:L-rhamnose mutarotase [Cyclobacterium amurskyense]|uniref:L-fucose mutarotase, type 2 n=1 Tax=Cyclobacterium amurskyense TaxID=320787 RepID=A0A0H4PJP0_9BACT|nr:L-rhamnose mutarotase [Cyclobacterium amurskyense]AKP53275.1 L-fucose mutarotase, type 2 [Cyclobacterium amurskyense]|tara:strand:- start:103 stop:432 length:330 start_codon:yes stop_codon:yes gene_type:complete